MSTVTTGISPDVLRPIPRKFNNFACARLFGCMFLKSLTLKGFKSFAETTHLELEPGLTVVVGPNGSGKSNIVDAVAWVLGAQGARAIRSNKMEDVIFAGTSKKAALGRAEVTLTIDNHSGRIPVDLPEVTITRTLFRTGESDYALNNVPCRLLDIQELLSDSGVGRQQHVIVSQGQLAAILDSRPEDRRSVVEEAAGILKYRKRRERAQRRLEATESNVVRLGDVLREIRRTLRPLERQAESARRHEEMATELAAIRLHIAGREFAGLRTRAETSAREKVGLAGRENDLRAVLARLDADVMLAEAELSSYGQGASAAAEHIDDPFAGHDINDALTRAESLYQKARGQLAFLGERRRSIERDRNAFLDQGVVETLSAEAARLSTELTHVDHLASDLPPRFDALDDDEVSLTTARNEFLEQWGADTDHSDRTGPTAAQVRGELNGARSAAERTRAEFQRADGRFTILSERVARLTEQAAQLETELASISAQLGDSAGESPSVSPAVAEATSARVAAEASLIEAESAVTVGEEALRTADGERRAWQARLEALSAALDEARAKAGAKRLAGLDGIVGTLLDLVEIDAGWEAAFEAAIGEAVSSVVVSDSSAARAALSRLHESNASGAVLALGALAGSVATELPAAVAEGDAVRARVRSSHPAVETLLDALLHSSVVVDGGWAKALDVALAHPTAVVVTKGGDRFSVSGWRAGAGSSGATGAARDEAAAHAAHSKEHADAAAASLELARAAFRQSRQAVSTARTIEQERLADHQRLVSRLGALRTSQPRVLADRVEALIELESVEAQRTELADRQRADEASVLALTDSLPALLEAENELAARQAARREAAQRLDTRTAAVAALRRELEVQAAGIDERRRMLGARLDEIEVRLSRSVEEREQAEARRHELDALAEHTESLHAIVMDRAEQLEVGIVSLREARRRQNEAARAASGRLDGLRRERQGAEKEVSQLREKIQRAEIDDAEIRLRLETLVSSIRREFEVEPESASTAECPAMPNAATAPTTRARDLERDLRLLGPINPLALEEFTALQERHALIEGQLDDVKASRRDLVKVIKAIDDEIVSVFLLAYADVAENFERLFSTLFPGGQGRLRLTDPANPLETGIEVEARPSGKNVRKLSLLSGGERSLTAMAFLFAVFRSRPSPFYLLDEVEASLDDVNLHRFIALLDEFRSEAQLLVVSHQKRTMEAADSLYGVTMQPGGSSKVVSERVAARA